MCVLVFMSVLEVGFVLGFVFVLEHMLEVRSFCCLRVCQRSVRVFASVN